MHLRARLAHLRIRPQRPHLLVLALHQLLPEWQNPEELPFLPFQPLTVAQLDKLLAALLANGYRPADPDRLAQLDARHSHLLITFDDGYANTHLALPVLERHGLSALYCVNTAHCLQQKAWWWDVVWRATRDMGWPIKAIYRHIERLKQLPPQEVEEALLEQYGPEALQPVGELDRPLTATELQQLDAHPLAWLGLHGHSHQHLHHLDAIACQAELHENWQTLTGLGTQPLPILAYPNGDYSQPATQGNMVQFAFTTRAGINRLNRIDAQRYRLRRVMPTGLRSLETQLRYYRSFS
ncbi:MAG: polysaccharide deacetylase family protein [Bacteroidetes bacterium]|jgi:peptidoglycan/xylan/chitin deacetylase (PgdA/CDA1 family)|nr:polysaccharide deacetylase family protein [Bacteroidota bacterium]